MIQDRILCRFSEPRNKVKEYALCFSRHKKAGISSKLEGLSVVFEVLQHLFIHFVIRIVVCVIRYSKFYPCHVMHDLGYVAGASSCT